jgi:hypothetical protein
VGEVATLLFRYLDLLRAPGGINPEVGGGRVGGWVGGGWVGGWVNGWVWRGRETVTACVW